LGRESRRRRLDAEFTFGGVRIRRGTQRGEFVAGSGRGRRAPVKKAVTRPEANEREVRGKDTLRGGKKGWGRTGSQPGAFDRFRGVLILTFLAV